MATVDAGGEEFTVYADIDTADAYLAGAFHATDWASLTDDVKGKALVTATRILDRQRWLGSKTVSDQVLAWPRTGTGVSGVEDDTIPEAIIAGAIELALTVSAGADVQNQATTEETVKRIQAGSVSIENFRSTQQFSARFPQIIQELIGVYLLGGSASFGGPIVSGTDACSPFEDKYDFNEGL